MSLHLYVPRSPRGLLHSLIALLERPQRHRRHGVLNRVYTMPPDVWWGDDDRWFPQDTPPRQGNRLTPLVDGQDAMRVMYEAMDRATESIYLASWYLTPPFQMIRRHGAASTEEDQGAAPTEEDQGAASFLALMARKADEVDVRILLWPGSIVGKFNRRHVHQARHVLTRANPRIKVVLDTHERFSHCQHQKALVVDGRVAFVGGLDPTNFDADRWDVQQHRFREGRNWHDVHWRIEGPCVADVAANFRQRWNAARPRDPIAPVALPAPLPDGAAAQVQRTIPKGVYAFAPRGIFGIAHAYLRAIARAERFIYLENQYLWSPELTDALCDAVRRGHRTGLRVVMVLPAHPNVGKGDSDRHLEDLLKADDGRGAFRAYTLYTSAYDEQRRRYKYRPVYVHAKVAVIDDAWATAGSANLNGRGMVTDSEINVATTHTPTVQALRLRLWAEHLNTSEDELRDVDPITVLDGRWVETAEAQRAIVNARSGLLNAALYPYPLGRVDADFGPGEVESALLDR